MKNIFIIIFLIFIISCQNGQSSSIEKNQKKGSEKTTDTLSENQHSKVNQYFSLSEINIAEYEKIKLKIEIKKPSDLGIIKKKGIFELKFDNGKSKKYKDINNKSDETDQQINELKGLFKEIGYYLIQISYYETGEFILINKNNGNEFKLWGNPIISPDNDKIISYSDAFGYDVMPNGIQYYKHLPNGELIKLWEYSIEDWKPSEILWIDNDILLLKQIIPEIVSPTKKEETKYFKMSLN